jgi:hypothetical protein
MTLFSMRAALALLLAASLASCGGGSSKETYPVGGTVSGLLYGPLVLTTGSQSVNVNPTGLDSTGVANVVSYTFPQTLSYGDPFYVQLGTTAPHEACVVGQTAADSAGHMATINVAVVCTLNSYQVAGYVTGLTGEGLQLINGSTSSTPLTITVAGVATAAAAQAAGTVTPSFAFDAVYYNTPYGVSVLTQPAGQTCTVTNGNGVMGDALVINVGVNCVANP